MLIVASCLCPCKSFYFENRVGRYDGALSAMMESSTDLEIVFPSLELSHSVSAIYSWQAM